MRLFTSIGLALTMFAVQAVFAQKSQSEITFSSETTVRNENFRRIEITLPIAVVDQGVRIDFTAGLSSASTINGYSVDTSYGDNYVYFKLNDENAKNIFFGGKLTGPIFVDLNWLEGYIAADYSYKFAGTQYENSYFTYGDYDPIGGFNMGAGVNLVFNPAKIGVGRRYNFDNESGYGEVTFTLQF